ncbi:MAG: 16S rRNA (uracil(1498)-N(3))-methyltransferase [Proteobacteria bacterium]|nr:MAG: 16S rRNA (uracil(1498)-N(3))-methyltransferase [Pseudomonadota bacterium]
MRVSRIYLPINHRALTDTWVIEQPKAHYIRNVLRLKPGHRLQFFTATGRQYNAVIAAVNKHDVVIQEIMACQEEPPNSQLQITIVQGISASDRMDYSIQKAAELGCHQVQPVITEFCSHRIAPHKYSKKQEHWQAVAISACEQSGRADVMLVETIKPLTDVVSDINQGIFLEPTADRFIHDIPKELQQQCHVFIGPEGGFSPTELSQFESRGYCGIKMGSRVLRTETMAPVVLSAMHTLYGDFNPKISRQDKS